MQPVEKVLLVVVVAVIAFILAVRIQTIQLERNGMICPTCHQVIPRR